MVHPNCCCCVEEDPTDNVPGVPVATVGISNSVNAALLAVRILGTSDPALERKLNKYAENARKENLEVKNPRMKELGWQKYYEQMKKNT